MPDSTPLKLFIIYAREDQRELLQFRAHLRPLELYGELTVWYDGEILPGEEWNKAIKKQLETADIVILFISSNFFDSEYIIEKELKQALERHQKGEIIVVPIIVKPCLWKAHREIKTFQVLPQDAKPVSVWDNVDEAWVNVGEDLQILVEQHYRQTESFYQKLNTNQKNANVQDTLNQPYESMGQLAWRVLKQIEEVSNSVGLSGVPSGFIDIDHLTSGWQPSDLIILAARPGMGKTSMGLSLALNAAKDFGRPVAFFSLEMSSTQMMSRLIALAGEISTAGLRVGILQEYEWQQLLSISESLSSLPIYIDDTPAINIFELRTRCRQLKNQRDIQLIIIDYLQLISEETDKPNREQEIASITRGLKNMARELNVPVIALSQLTRNVEVRGGSKRPQLSDLRDSGPLEIDADIVAFLYRPEYYQILEDENGESLKGIAEFIIAKHRNGRLDTIKLKFDSQFSKFANLESPPLAESRSLPPILSIPINEEDIPF